MSSAKPVGAVGQVVYLAGGCFWGLEELISALPGVVDTEAGYSGGSLPDPTYHHHPGHAEAVAVYYDPLVISLDQLLDYFFRIHDPTTLNRQGNDVGSSYRSAVFYSSDDQYQVVQRAIDRNQPNWSRPIVTRLEPFKQFWLAEPEHQDYLRKNPGGYSCHYERNFD